MSIPLPDCHWPRRSHAPERNEDLREYHNWIGRSQTICDVLEPARANALDILSGGSGGFKAGEKLPLLHHWLYFWEVKPASSLGPDGHPAKGNFLPPVPLPRRMWAGGRVEFRKPLFIGQKVTKKSTILTISEKHGRGGRLVFVTVQHQLDAGDGVAIVEEQDLVYREASTEMLPLPVSEPSPQSGWSETIVPDSIMLFRFSALTMNGHRIHYDKPYAVEQECYPALVVHGPLQAIMMIQLAQSNLELPVSRFEFRGQQPAFESLPLHICGNPSSDGAELWTQQGDAKNMTATVWTK